jgi:hypothetical protein
VQPGYTVALTISVTRFTIDSTALDLEEEMETTVEEVEWLEMTLEPEVITLVTSPASTTLCTRPMSCLIRQVTSSHLSSMAQLL